MENGPIAGYSDRNGIMTSEHNPTFVQADRSGQKKTESNSVSHRVIEAVAKESNRSASELEPLYYSIDPDALDSIFSSPSGKTVKRLSFTYSGYQVTVGGEGSIDVVTAHGRTAGETQTQNTDADG